MKEDVVRMQYVDMSMSMYNMELLLNQRCNHKSKSYCTCVHATM